MSRDILQIHFKVRIACKMKLYWKIPGFYYEGCRINMYCQMNRKYVRNKRILTLMIEKWRYYEAGGREAVIRISYLVFRERLYRDTKYERRDTVL